MLKAALCGALIGLLLTGVFLYVRGKIRKATDHNDLASAGPGAQKFRNDPVCLYSTHDPLGSAIVRARRSKQ